MIRDHAALVAYLDARRRTPFAWGSDANDCVSFAAGAVQALTGKNPLQGVGRWSSKAAALRALASKGGLEAAVDSVLTPIAPAMAQRGDIALVAKDDVALLMVIEGDLLVGPDVDGAVRLPRKVMIKAWSAG